MTVAPGSALLADIGGVIGIGFPASVNPTQGGVVLGQASIGPLGAASGGSGGGTGSGSGSGGRSGGGICFRGLYQGRRGPHRLLGTQCTGRRGDLFL